MTTFVVEKKKNMLNVIYRTMIRLHFATEAETQKNVLYLMNIEGLKFKVIGRRQIVIYE